MQYTAHLRSYLIINYFRCPLCDIKQIMTSVYILSCFMPFLAYRDKKRANGIKQDRIDTEVIICFISQSGHQKISIIRWLTRGGY